MQHGMYTTSLQTFVSQHQPPSCYSSWVCKLLLVGDAASQLAQQMAQELELLAQVVEATPDDVITRPGEGIGIYSPGHKHLAEIGLLVNCADVFSRLPEAGWGSDNWPAACTGNHQWPGTSDIRGLGGTRYIIDTQYQLMLMGCEGV